MSYCSDTLKEIFLEPPDAPVGAAGAAAGAPAAGRAAMIAGDEKVEKALSMQSGDATKVAIAVIHATDIVRELMCLAGTIAEAQMRRRRGKLCVELAGWRRRGLPRACR